MDDFDQRKSMRLRNTPRQDISIQRELDDVALRSINEIANAKAQKLSEEPDSVERIKRQDNMFLYG